MLKYILFPIFSLYLIAAHSITILIDPGHGGEDPGAKNGNILEKDLTLAISKQIQKRLEKKYTVFLTRSIDRTVSLQERADMAEKLKADYFISVHINSSESTASKGFETFYLDNHKDAAVKKVEDIENANTKGDELIINKILIDLVIEKTASKSKTLAESIHSHINKYLKSYKIPDRGIRPGLFYVLALSKRPGVLLEPAFLSNNEDASKIMRLDFRNAYAEAVAKGIDEFIIKEDRRRDRSSGKSINLKKAKK